MHVGVFDAYIDTKFMYVAMISPEKRYIKKEIFNMGSIGVSAGFRVALITFSVSLKHINFSNVLGDCDPSGHLLRVKF